MKNIPKLKREIRDKINKARDLHETSKKEQRDFTSSEKLEYETLMADIDDLKGELRKAEREHEEITGEPYVDGVVVGRRAYGTSEPATSSGEIKMLRHGESFAEAVGANDLPDGIRADELSTGRMIRGLVKGDWKGAEAEQRAMQGQESPAGGYFLPGGLSSRLIDLARANQVTSQAGAITIPVETDSLTVPKVLADPSVQWRGELEAITESDPTFGSVVLTPKVCAVLVKISQELYEDGVGVGDAVERVLAQALATEKDRVVLMGGGAGNTNEPVGVYHTDGVNVLEMGTDGADLTNYNPFVNAIEAVENANAIPGSVIKNPRTKADLATLVTGIASDETKLTPPEDYKNLRRLVTTSIPNNLEWGSSGAVCSAAFVGGFSSVWVGVRNQVRIDVSPHGTGVFNEMGLWVRAFIRVDVAVVRPAELAVITGITTSR